MNEQTKKLITNGGIVLAVLIVGMFIGMNIPAGKGGENTFQAGWDAAKKRLTESGYAFPLTAEVTTLNGEVTEAKSGSLTMKIRPLEPLADPELDVRTVTFDANTKFYRSEPKDPTVYQKEMEEYGRKMQQLSGKAGAPAPAAAGTPPQPVVQKEITAADIRTGDMVIVTAGKNVKEEKTFVATTIVAQTVVSPAAMAAPVTPR